MFPQLQPIWEFTGPMECMCKSDRGSMKHVGPMEEIQWVMIWQLEYTRCEYMLPVIIFSRSVPSETYVPLHR